MRIKPSIFRALREDPSRWSGCPLRGNRDSANKAEIFFPTFVGIPTNGRDLPQTLNKKRGSQLSLDAKWGDSLLNSLNLIHLLCIEFN